MIIYFYCMLKVFKNTNNCIFICMIPFLKLKIVKKWVLRKWVFIFCLRFRRHFLRHTNFLGFLKFREKNFFIRFLKYHRKMYRLGPCIPILRVLFWLKVQKRCVYVNILFLVMILAENVFIGLKKGISKKMHWVAAKHTADIFRDTDT